MPIFDGTAFGQEIVTLTRGYFDRSIEPLARRIAELEKELDGQADIAVLVAEAVAAIPAPQDGKDADPEQVAVLVRANVERVLASLPVPENGKDGEPGLAGRDGIDGKDGEPGKDGRDGEPGRDGLDAAMSIVPDDTADLVARTVKLLAEMPSATAINAEEMQRRSQPVQPPVHVHLPTIDIPQIVMPDSIEMKAPVVNVHVPEQKKRNTETTVVSHDSKGRIKKFVQKEI